MAQRRFPAVLRRVAAAVRGRLVPVLLAGATAAPLPGREFIRPTEEASRAAIGPLDGLPAPWPRLLAPGADFAPVRQPEPGDWLATHAEAGQTFVQFRDGEIFRPSAAHGVLYLQPLGAFPRETSPALEDLRRYAAAFFQLRAVVLPAEPVDGGAFEPRVNAQSGRRQLHTRRIHDRLRARLPADAFCVVAVTMDDLYPDPRWNFVYGEAVPDWRVGVFSFARYDPAFFGEARPADFRRTQLRESANVLVHEIGHMFGAAHCIWFDCVMNGANNRRELRLASPHACPVCLRKLHHSVGFDPARRYRELAEFSRAQGWAAEAAWLARRLALAADTAP